MLKHRFAAVLLAFAGFFAPIQVSAQSYTFRLLASFGGSNGKTPLAGLIVDGQGNLFGTTQLGGAHDDGVVFELPAGTSTPTALASFDGTNGANPVGSLYADAQGNLLGTAAHGGDRGLGTLFEYATNSHDLTAVASFDGTYGVFPNAGLVADIAGNLFGTTSHGGTDGQGNVFKLPVGGNTPINVASCIRSAGPRVPDANVIVDAEGNLFGTTTLGGPDNNGTIFELPAGTSTPVALASFDGTNGAFPQAALIADSHGNLFGVTQGGGPGGDEEGLGVVFELPAGGDTPTVLASFNGANGTGPLGTLFADVHGNLFGTTNMGGAHDKGTVFELLSGSDTPITLVDFDGSNGEFPSVGLVADARGDLFGTATGGGANNDGVIFELVRTNIPGDYDGNDVVDQGDYDLWRQTFGSTTNLAADGNGNGVVDAADYVLWRDRVGQTAGGGAALPSAEPLSASVPEPATLMLIILGLGGWLLRPRRLMQLCTSSDI